MIIFSESVRDLAPDDQEWITDLLIERWGGTRIVVKDEMVHLLDLPALVAGDQEGLATFRLRPDGAELMSLDAVHPGHGVGTALIDALVARLVSHSIACLWVTTTNDNIEALRFYQRRGFELRHLRPGAVNRARDLKPEIPLIGSNGIPLRDELELCRRLS